MNGTRSGVELPKPEETSVKEDWLSILKGFEREELEELLSQPFCGHCEGVLHTRVISIANRKRTGKLSISNGDYAQSDDTHDRCLESCIQEALNTNGSVGSPGSIHLGSQKRYVDKFSPSSVDSKRVTSSLCEFSSLEDELQS
ncbi:hypothetical protein L1987_32035 [Smallanthus sonchifolius]|uniref:Uncharacterized protein n=1 Tax=Smallanthus sonchifolius TaxID=185202 RepID=A0ACB9I7Y3_9ASTR|nr:hypothetical protein L1987_32035 [Smallanthus sonchifolius]